MELEEQAEFRSEYIDGEIIPIPGGTSNHNKIALNFCRKFPLTLQEQEYEVYMVDVKLWIHRYHLYTYPDVMVVQGEPVYEGNNKTAITNPMLIVEVLSKSTQAFDKTDKFKYYRSISTLQEYILIDQYSFSIEQYVKKTEGEWTFKEYEGEDAVLVLKSVDFQITFKDIYARVNFEANEEE
ncbi:Uma2 family endonuclease [Scytonema sp. NUACC26]|uniref:Uma2 family endonuclease n=1 Tax=Scytonema sp. NUACC26 TaxID=3140176 RepID=UPI0034DBC640